MNRLIAITAGAGAIAALAVGCGSSGSSSSSSSSSSKPASSPSSSSSTPAASAAVHTANSKYGQILVDGSGRTLYMLTADKGPMSTCYSTCASIWPPQTTTGMPANSGVTASLVGTTTRTDNTMQVVYNGHPLYTFSHDAKAGDVNGEGLATFGGTWYVVGTNGNAITAVPSTTPSTPAPSSSGGGYNY
ncbi:putative lipoprotein with Yx(FWY)xxD motif [Catenulispora sp. MAP5-51]|uniref:COG4315 family predicted lipoprotein n=1 Tax=Catenulispora sp. MAP5-51 TaxID=3156298 RepID=UPI003517E42C